MPTIVKTWTQWLRDSRFSYLTEEQKQQTLAWLEKVRDKVLDKANLKYDDIIMDVGTGSGLLAFGAFERMKSMPENNSPQGMKGKVIASDAFIDCVEECFKIAKTCGIEQEMGFLQADASDTKLDVETFDVLVMRSVLVHIVDKQKAINEFFRILKPGGRISVFEPVISNNTKYFELMNPAMYSNFEELKKSEEKMTSDSNDPLMNFDENSLKKCFKNAGFSNIDVEIEVQSSSYQVSKEMIDPWLNTPPSPGSLTVKQKFLRDFSEKEVEDFINILKLDLDGKTIEINSPTLYINAIKKT